MHALVAQSSALSHACGMRAPLARLECDERPQSQGREGDGAQDHNGRAGGRLAQGNELRNAGPCEVADVENAVGAGGA